MPTRHEEMRDQVKAFHKENPEVWNLFVAFAMDRIKLGYKHYSAKAVFERVRWETSTPYHKDNFKLNNNYPSFYARAFMKKYPEHEGFFRTRHQASKDEPMTGLRELEPRDFEKRTT